MSDGVDVSKHCTCTAGGDRGACDLREEWDQNEISLPGYALFIETACPPYVLNSLMYYSAYKKKLHYRPRRCCCRETLSLSRLFPYYIHSQQQQHPFILIGTAAGKETLTVYLSRRVRMSFLFGVVNNPHNVYLRDICPLLNQSLYNQSSTLYTPETQKLSDIWDLSEEGK